MIEPLIESRSFQTRHGSRVAIIGGGLLGTTLALRYRQAGRIVTVFEAAERADRRGHASIASRDRFLLELLEELDLARSVRWNATGQPGLRFGALAGGRAQIVERLRDRARAIDVDLRLGTPVQAIFGRGTGFAVDAGSEVGEFDQVLLTVPSPVAASLLSELPDGERVALQSLGHVGILQVSFVLTRPNAGRYLSYVLRGRDQFVVVDPAALFPAEQRRSVLYVSRPLATNHDLFSATDREVIEHFARALPGRAEIMSARVLRVPHAFAHGQSNFQPFSSSISGLSLVSAANMGGGRNHLERTAALATSAFRSLCAERIS